jgi:hypothetical protein
VRWLLVGLAAVLITAALTVASVVLITPDAFVDPCDRVELVPPIECASPAPPPG